MYKKKLLLFFVIANMVSCSRGSHGEDNLDANMVYPWVAPPPEALVTGQSDLIWSSSKPISLNFSTASKKALATQISELTSMQEVQILSFNDLPFNAILPYTNNYKPGFVPSGGVFLGKAYYFPYKTSPTTNFLQSIGNAEVKMVPSVNDPQYVLTGEMNGCSLIVTKLPTEQNFRVWHFPSPNSYSTYYNQFKQTFKGKIYGEIKASDYIGTNVGDVDAVNYLYFNTTTAKWELSCIPVRRIVETSSAKLALWNGNWLGASTKPRFKKTINFSNPIE